MRGRAYRHGAGESDRCKSCTCLWPREIRAGQIHRKESGVFRPLGKPWLYYVSEFFCYLIIAIGLLIFLELLRLKFCGLNLYTSQEIDKRQLKDFEGLPRDLLTQNSNITQSINITQNSNIKQELPEILTKNENELIIN